MRLCSGHMHDLDHAIRHKGMGQLIHPERAEEFATRWLRGVALFHEFDPLVVAHLEIHAKAREALGGSTDGCALCDMSRILQLKTLPESWIDNVSDMMLLVAKTNHLVT